MARPPAGRQKLKALEDRLQTQVEGSLGEALGRGASDDATRRLCGLLLAVDRWGRGPGGQEPGSSENG